MRHLCGTRLEGNVFIELVSRATRILSTSLDYFLFWDMVLKEMCGLSQMGESHKAILGIIKVLWLIDFSGRDTPQCLGQSSFCIVFVWRFITLNMSQLRTWEKRQIQCKWVKNTMWGVSASHDVEVTSVIMVGIVYVWLEGESGQREAPLVST